MSLFIFVAIMSLLHDITILKRKPRNSCRYNVLMNDQVPLNNVSLGSGGVYSLVLLRDPSTKARVRLGWLQKGQFALLVQ